MARHEVIHSYNHEHNYGMTKNEFTLFALLHKEGNDKTRKLIEDILTGINFHSECSMFKNNEYDEAICQW